MDNKRYCSFCGKEILANDENVFVGSFGGVLCKKCFDVASLIAANSKMKNLEDNNSSTTYKEIPTPTKIKKYLDRYIIGQDKPKMVISTLVYNHYKRINQQINDDEIEIEKTNALFIGPTGNGKTLIAKTIAKYLDVPFAIADATSLTQSGYVGDDVETVLTRLLQNCDYDVKKAEHGIVFIDEIDKIACKGSGASITRDVSGEGVQQGLLKIIEGADILVPPNGGRKHPEAKMISINTKNILFICAGAFDGIEKKVASRHNKKSIGFIKEDDSNNIDKNDCNALMEHITANDVKSFGLIPELVGRLPMIVTFELLSKEQLIRVLTEPKNAIIKQYKKMFELDGIDLRFNDDAIEYIADKAIENKLGARGLRGIVESILIEDMYRLPGTDTKELIVDIEYAKSKIKL